MIPFQYGDIVCYKGISPHEDAVLMVVGECRHKKPQGSGLVDLAAIDSRYPWNTNCKDPAMWQICTHLLDGPI